MKRISTRSVIVINPPDKKTGPKGPGSVQQSYSPSRAASVTSDTDDEEANDDPQRVNFFCAVATYKQRSAAVVTKAWH